MDKGTADGKDDTQSHGRCEDRGHTGRWELSVTRLTRGELKPYLVTMVLMGSSGPVGFMMNQKSMLTMFTPQMDCGNCQPQRSREDRWRSTYAVEVEAITEHQLPVRNWLKLERLKRPVDSKNEGGGVQQSCGQPVDALPVVLGLCDASLSVLERGGWTKGSGAGNLWQDKGDIQR